MNLTSTINRLMYLSSYLFCKLFNINESKDYTIFIIMYKKNQNCEKSSLFNNIILILITVETAKQNKTEKKMRSDHEMGFCVCLYYVE